MVDAMILIYSHYNRSGTRSPSRSKVYRSVCCVKYSDYGRVHLV